MFDFQRMSFFWWKVLLAFYTLARLLAILVYLQPYWADEPKNVSRNNAAVNIAIGMILIPILGALTVVLSLPFLSSKSPLQLWSWRQSLCCAIFLWDRWPWSIFDSFYIGDFVFDCLFILMNMIQAHMMNLRLEALGWHHIPRFILVLAFMASGYVFFASVTQVVNFYTQTSWCDSAIDGEIPWLPDFGCKGLMKHMEAFLAIFILQACTVWYSAFIIATKLFRNHACSGRSGRTVFWLCLNGLLPIMGSYLSAVASVESIPGELPEALLEKLHGDAGYDSSSFMIFGLLMFQYWTAGLLNSTSGYAGDVESLQLATLVWPRRPQKALFLLFWDV